MADHVGWQNFWWLNVAATGASILYGIVGFPETKWTRAPAGHDAVSAPAPADSSSQEKSATTPSSQAEVEDVAQQQEAENFLGKGSPSRQQWHLFQLDSSPMKAIWFDLWTPWKIFGFPIVLFASFVVSWSCSNFLILNLTQSQVFAAPPYNMSSQSIGKSETKALGLTNADTLQAS
jgi:hypothetical protein